jgi:chromosome condensin MukBEF MukE localization factor
VVQPAHVEVAILTPQMLGSTTMEESLMSLANNTKLLIMNAQKLTHVKIAHHHKDALLKRSTQRLKYLNMVVSLEMKI